MTGNEIPKGYAPYMAVFVGMLLCLPLWRELREPDAPIWNIFLAVFLVALVGAVFFGIRYLRTHKIEVGEARFTSSSKVSRPDQ